MTKLLLTKHSIIRFFLAVNVLFQSALVVNASITKSAKTIEKEISYADSLYRRQDYLSALDCYISQLSNLSPTENDSLYFIVLSRIGTVYDIYEDSGRALYYFDKVLSDKRSAKYDDITSKILIKMVILAFNCNDAQNARLYYRQQLAHPIADSISNGHYKYVNGGLVESLSDNHAKAIAYYRKALHYCGNNEQMANRKIPVMLEMATSFDKLSLPDSALRYLNIVKDVTERDSLDVYAADCYKLLYNHFKISGDSTLAAYYLQLYSDASDSIEQAQRLDTASLRLLQQHDHKARLEIEDLNAKIDLQTAFIIIVTLFFIASAIFIVYIRRQNIRLKESYHALVEKNQEIFELEEQSVSRNAVSTEQVASLSDNQSSLLERINVAINDIELISQPSFSLQDLSREVGSNSKYVSSIINKVYAKNFRTLINERKIREAARWLSDPTKNNESVADIAEQLGYSSSTVFINAFKKIIGMTPAAYRRYSN